MRLGLCVFLVVVVGCGSASNVPRENACTSANADPGACLAVAKERLARGDDDGAREYMEKLVLAINAAPACLRDHAPAGCFGGVVALLREPAVGLLAPFDVPAELLDTVPRWTGSEATGRRAQARTVLHGMCAVPGRDPVEQQRACLVLGDLVEDERMRRCGPECDLASAGELLAGWAPDDVIDGYAAACKVDTRSADPGRHTAFASDVARVYAVGTSNAVCAVGESSKRGASIPGALDAMARIRQTAEQQELSAQTAAKREVQRLAELEKQKVKNLEAAARAANAAFRDQMLAALGKSDWAVAYGLLTKHQGTPIDNDVATALQNAWEPFLAWTVAQSSTIGAYFELWARLSTVPTGHTIRMQLAALREAALKETKAASRTTRGRGGAWLYAAMMARMAGPGSPEARRADEAYAKLVAATRVSLVIDKLAPACAPLVKPAHAGRTVRATSTLQCVVEPERTVTTQEPFKLEQRVVTADGERVIEQDAMTEVTHRTFKVVVRGELTVTRGAPRRTIPIEYAAIVDDTDGSDTRTFDAERAAARAMIHEAVVGELEAADAEKAHAAGVRALAANRRGAAENHLVTHALLAGSSPELDQLLGEYGLTFQELLPEAR